MIGKFRPLYKQFNKFNFQKPLIQTNFSTLSNHLNEEMTVKMNLYLSQQVARQFLIKESTTLEELEEILKNEDKKIQTIKFQFNNEAIEDKNSNFLDFAVNNHLDIIINNKNHAFDIDLDGNAAYFNNSKFDAVFAKQEVPVLDAELINNFITLYNQQLETKYPGTSTYTMEQVQQTIFDTITIFSEKNNPVNHAQKVQIYQNLLKQLEQEEQNFKKIEDQATKKSQNFVKMILFLNLVQGAILFYLTYFVWGWDVVEPISYLLALSLETFILWHFIRKGKGLSLQKIFENKFQQNRSDLLFKNKSTNADKQREFLKSKIAHLKAKIQYG